MKYPVIRFRFGRRGNISPDSLSAIELEIYFERKRKFVSTGIRITPAQWSASGEVVDHPEAFMLNMKLRNFRKPYDDYVSQLISHRLPFSFSNLELHIHTSEGGGSFVDFVAKHIEQRADICEATKKTHRKLVTALKDFGQIISFSDLSAPNIRAYDAWLHQRYSKQTTVASYHKFMKVYIHLAMGLELIHRDPYIGIKIDRGRSEERKYLSESELKALEALTPPDSSLQRVRDLFLFQCYTGLAYSDMEKFDFSKAQLRNGKYVIRDTRCKSGISYYLVLLTPALRILEKYNYQLPLISNQKYNAYLKALAVAAGLKFRLTSHVGRHTYATWCLNQGIPIETLAKMLGHTNTNTTQIYAKMLDKTVESAFDFLESKL